MSDVPDSVRLVDFKASRGMTSLPDLIPLSAEERPHTLLSLMWNAISSPCGPVVWLVLPHAWL